MPEEKEITINEAARTALLVQDAVNLSGVVQAFRDVVMNAIWPEARRLGEGTDWVNRHPICALFISKLDSMNGFRTLAAGGSSCHEFNEAYWEVKRLAGEEAKFDDVTLSFTPGRSTQFPISQKG